MFYFKIPSILFSLEFLRNWDLYNYENVDSFITDIGDKKCHLVTGDGGFDYSENYNLQEQSSYKLLYSEFLDSLPWLYLLMRSPYVLLSYRRLGF